MGRARSSAALLFAALLAGGAFVSARSAQMLDGATIVNSGSTNALGYRIEIRSDGSGSVVLQDRSGTPQSTPKPFSITLAQAKRFFADLKAARDGNAKGVPCMKSASFGTRTHIDWHAWTSPDLDCPPGDALSTALERDLSVIRAASGVETMTLFRHGALPGAPHLPVVAPSPGPSSS
jgi:hypothetical protein